jgi:ferredoxin-nitrate reductase
MIDRISDIWGERAPHAAGSPWPERVDSHFRPGASEDDVERWVRSACLLCSNGCGIQVAVAGGEVIGVRGDAADRVNRGRLGPKGLYGWRGQFTDDRLTRPLVREGGSAADGGRLVETDWDTAMERVVGRSRELLDSKGPLSHGFYTSGQLMLEEYYTLAVIGKAGIGTPHMDGNTRLCTATAAAALKESFGADGQPGSYADIEHATAIALYGHNVAETQTVLWARMLDRLHGDDPPALLCVDPRRTEVARYAERGGVHLPVRPGTNLALLNGLLREMIANDWVDRGWVGAHTVGFDDLAATVEEYTPEHVGEICAVPADDVRRAAELVGTADRLLSTVLQGVYQSHQATAAACQVNNVHLLRGQIGRPGCGVLQMNGQPTAQNNRETGANGDLPGFRNWANPRHIEELARLWNCDPMTIPHWAPPTHAMQIFRYAEQGSIGFLWIAATNPAVSLPELARIRRVLAGDQCFVVVSDAYRTETTELADVVLPAALWLEKTGTYTNADRTVHLSEQAVDPPGEARSDLRIWLDYARRMGFTDKDGNAVPSWTEPEEAFDDWRRVSAGRPCDYTGISYARLRERGPVQWGGERLYGRYRFPTDSGYCESYGMDLDTGGVRTESEHRAVAAAGRAFLRAAAYTPPPEEPDETYPLRYVTGRNAYHWHTRTKTARSEPLNDAAPQPWVELSEEDAKRLGIADGDLVGVESARGRIEVPARIGGPREGTVFVPFHYGEHAANELTLTSWDPVSKQPVFKVAAARVVRLDEGG